MRWLLRVSEAPRLSRIPGARRLDSPSLEPAGRLEALAQQFPVPFSTRDPDFRRKLAKASECLSAASREIQRSVRTPLSPGDASALSELLMKISDLLATENVTTVLGRPVSGRELADTGYKLLDSASEYHLLAQHFYSAEVRAARARRPSDAAEAEIAAVAGKAASLKSAVMRYLRRVAEALQSQPKPPRCFQDAADPPAQGCLGEDAAEAVDPLPPDHGHDHRYPMHV